MYEPRPHPMYDFCPDPNQHYAKCEFAPLMAPLDVWTALRAEFARGNYSMRGLAARYSLFGVTRSQVRRALRDFDAAYMNDVEAREGLRRRTVLDHEGNRARRRKYPQRVP
ncbi:hypothetical protein AB0D90_23480 [Streptomyces althioticus]|uniref:hypothetical protein n=1 Tax=Streptomyces althioticus TaxID=83380 RepID=UPI00340A4759